ncbi:hypothetical protein AAGG74_17990 [Bacillus mexicanus]|uniref:hypothetical protein n=1 Tax=Bacillus mexicanus TaxID=2834415 RepID=UPI003D1A6508
MFTKKDQNRIKEIEVLFKKIEIIYNELDSDVKEFIREFHTEETNIPYCIRWGINNTEELLRTELVYDIGNTFSVIEQIELKNGYIPTGTKAKISDIDLRILYSESSKPFQIEFEEFVAYKEKDEADGIFEEFSLNEIKKCLK